MKKTRFLELRSSGSRGANRHVKGESHYSLELVQYELTRARLDRGPFPPLPAARAPRWVGGPGGGGWGEEGIERSEREAERHAIASQRFLKFALMCKCSG